MNRKTFEKIRRQKGFSLIEAIVTIVILGIVATISSGIILHASDGYLSSTTSAQLNAELSTGLARAVRDMRNIMLDGGAEGIAPDIDQVRSSSITWSDNNSLQLTGSNLELTVDGSTSVLLSDVSAFSVQCYNENNQPMGTSLDGDQCDDVRRVQLTITVERNGISETLRTKVYIRATSSAAEGIEAADLPDVEGQLGFDSDDESGGNDDWDSGDEEDNDWHGWNDDDDNKKDKGKHDDDDDGKKSKGKH